MPLKKIKQTFRDVTLMLKDDASAYYQLLGDDVLEGLDGGFVDKEKSLWLNLGYWKEAQTYREACEAMARLLSERAQFGAGDWILDAGFGYGEQDILWAREYAFEKIVGVNVTPLHVEVGRSRVKELGLEARIDLREGSATQLPFENASFDKVVALESAFHFNTRQEFFAEAWRVLKPGGRMVLADMLPTPDLETDRMSQHLTRKRFCIPDANIYTATEYERRLLELGFENVQIESIAGYVYPGMFAYTEQRFQDSKAQEEVVVELSEEAIEECRGAERWGNLLGLDDYVIASAEKM